MSTDLENKILNYAKKLRKKHEYPSFVSGAEFNYIKKLGKSGNIMLQNIALPFKNKIESKFGAIGSKNNNSTIGYCAEQAAANKIIIQHPASISKLNVGSAIRPRTLQYGKRCNVCSKLF